MDKNQDIFSMDLSLEPKKISTSSNQSPPKKMNTLAMSDVTEVKGKFDPVWISNHGAKPGKKFVCKKFFRYSG